MITCICAIINSNKNGRKKMIGRQVKICTGCTQSIQILRKKKIKKIYCPMTVTFRSKNIFFEGMSQIAFGKRSTAMFFL